MSSEGEKAKSMDRNTSAIDRPSTAPSSSSTRSSLLAPTASFEKKKVQNESKQHEEPKPKKISKGPTIPTSPKFHSKPRNQVVLSQEEREAQAIAASKEAEKKRFEANKRAYEKLKATAGMVAKSVSSARSTKQLTVPETPIHHLTQRMGTKDKAPPAPPDDVKKALNFGRSGGEPAEKPREKERGLTQPQPFSFATERRFGRASDNHVEPSLTAAEAAAQFQKDPRSHYVPAQAATKLTAAHAPVLETDLRLKAHSKPRAETTEEREAREMEEFARHPFKAKPVGADVPSKVLQTAPVPQKQLTEFKPFELRTDKRASVSRATVADSPDVFTFKARPMPNFRAEDLPDSPSELRKPALTIPQSPAFHGGGRASAAPARRQVTKESERATSPDRSSESSRGPPPGGVTKPKPFHLYTGDRGELYKEILQKKIQFEREQEKRTHDLAVKKAVSTHVPAAVKDSTKVFAPKTSSKPLTNIEEFDLASTRQHEDAQAKLKARLNDEEKARVEERNFHARPVPKAILSEPDFVSFLPSEGGQVGEGRGMGAPPRKPVQAQEVRLSTSDRVAKRMEFDSAVARKQSEVAAEKEAEKRRAAAEEQQELKDLRRKSISEGGFCFKASANPFATPKTVFKGFVPEDDNIGKPIQQHMPKPAIVPKPMVGKENIKSESGQQSGKAPVRIKPYGETGATTRSE